MKKFFDSAQEAHDFAYGKGVPFTRFGELHELSPADYQQLRAEGQWVIGIKATYRDESERDPYPVDREFISLDRFRLERSGLLQKSGVCITGYYCYQLSEGFDSIIHLEHLTKRNTLSKQLLEHTGDQWSSVAFCSEDRRDRLFASGVIIHRKTRKRFFISPIPLERLN